MTEAAAKTVTLTGDVRNWEMFDSSRRFAEVTMPFSEFSDYFMAVRYNAMKGSGQQREINEGHLKKLKAAMEEGTYTPAPGAASLDKGHRKNLTIENGRYSLKVDADNPLLLTDAGHRAESVSRIVKELSNKLSAATDEKEKKKLERWLSQAKNVPVTVTVYFDGDPQADFANLQLGRAVDTAHMFSLKIQSKLTNDPSHKLAFDAAKLLHKQAGGAFQNLIRFDSRGESPLPISTICSAGASDLASSLVGMAKVALANNVNDPAELANVVGTAFKALDDADPDGQLLAPEKVLAPISKGGKKGQSTMLVGVATVLGYRCWSAGRTQPSPEDLVAITDAANKTLNVPVAGSLSGPEKRQLLGRFATEALKDISTERVSPGAGDIGLPLSLLKTLTPSAYGAPALPKEPKPAPPAKEPKAAKATAEKKTKGKKDQKILPDVDTPIAVAGPAVESTTDEPVVAEASVGETATSETGTEAVITF